MTDIKKKVEIAFVEGEADLVTQMKKYRTLNLANNFKVDEQKVEEEKQ